MLSQIQLQRLIEQNAYGHIVQRVLTNGRCAGVEATSRLQESRNVTIAALGLALQRLTELSYGPCPTATRIAARLAAWQTADGRFAADQNRCGLADASAASVALRGMICWGTRFVEKHYGDNECRNNDAIKRGLVSLAANQNVVGSIGEDLVDDLIILWQLGDQPEFRSLIHLDNLIQAIDSADDDRLVEFGRVAHAAAA